MKTFDLFARVADTGGETVLGAADLGTHACYMLYGELRIGSGPVPFRPGAGHEEIFLILSGAVTLTDAEGTSVKLRPGEAFHLRGEERYEAVSTAPASAYVVAGGHSGDGHGHH